MGVQQQIMLNVPALLAAGAVDAASRRRMPNAAKSRHVLGPCGLDRHVLLGGTFKRASKQWSSYAEHCGVVLVSMTAKRAGRRTGATVKTLRKVKPLFWVFGIFEGTFSRRQTGAGRSKLEGGSNCPSAPVEPEPPSVLRVRADCGDHHFTTKFAIGVDYLLHQLLNHLPPRAPTPPRFIGQRTWTSRIGSRPKRRGMRVGPTR